MFNIVTAAEFRKALAAARNNNERIAGFTGTPDEMPEDGRYFLSETGLTGAGVTADGELVGVFSLEKRGALAVERAIQEGARSLNCFDGRLPEYYKRFGFREVGRVANWTPGGPDVVFMAR